MNANGLGKIFAKYSDEIYLPEPRGLSLLHFEKAISGALLIGAVVHQLFWRTSLIKKLK